MRIRKSSAAIATGAAALGLGLGTMGMSRAAASTSPSYNSMSFSGYAFGVYDGYIWPHSITARWTEPRIAVHGYRDAYSTVFTGFGDDNANAGSSGLSSSVPQIGTEADSVGGHTQYYAWYTTGPSTGIAWSPVRMHHVVRPGDHMAASAVVSGPLRDHFTLKITDTSSHGKWTTTKHIMNDYEPSGVSAGVTDPRYGLNLLANFGRVKFRNVTVNGRVLGSFAPHIGRYNFTRWTDGYTHTLAMASVLGATGNSFSVTWHRKN
jgi:Peptidase A4 family